MRKELLEKLHSKLMKMIDKNCCGIDFQQLKLSKVSEKVFDLEGKKVLNASDLVTAASNYVRSWIPAIRNLNGNLAWTCYVVDRKQGGTETLEKENIKTIPLAFVDDSLFEKAFELNIINSSQLNMLKDFYKDPYTTMREFLINHPEFLENALHADEKTQKRARLLIDGNLYNL